MTVRISICKSSADADAVAEYYRQRNLSTEIIDTANFKIWDHLDGPLEEPQLRFFRPIGTFVVVAR